MYCGKHKNIVRCNSIQNSKCRMCGRTIFTFNAPPVDTICEDCSSIYSICELCGEPVGEETK